MSVTGIVLFIVFLLVKSLLDKKKKEARREKTPEASAAPAAMGGRLEAAQVVAEDSAEARELLRRFFGGRTAELEERDVPRDVFSGIEAAPTAASSASLRHAEKWGKELQNSQEGTEKSDALALELSPAAMLQAVMLAEVIGRPKAQRRRSPYFRP